ncbi:MAG: hypothetical protein RLZZ28_1384 [Bacteroidota bacterium]|jgi:glycine/D-amino acid oxidase-like deaminating enzyme
MPHSFSIWEKETYYARQDIIIAGAGLMGLWAALELKERSPHLKITIIERKSTPGGASMRNAGFACFGSPTELLSNAKLLGTDAMLQLVETRYKGIEKINASFTAAAIGYDACGGYECINSNTNNGSNWNDELNELNKALAEITGHKQVFTFANEKLVDFGLIGFEGLIQNEMEAALHSGKLVSCLTRKAQDAGITILYGLAICNWEKQGQNICINTLQDISFSAKQLLFCTNAFTSQLLPQLTVTPARGQIILTSPIEGLALKGSFHYELGFYYWRNLGNRILLGGARNLAFDEEETLDLAGSVFIRNALESFLHKHLDTKYPFSIEQHWSGIMGFTQDRKPLVTQISDGIFASIACNGMGVALTPMIAENTAKLMMQYF